LPTHRLAPRKFRSRFPSFEHGALPAFIHSRGGRGFIHYPVNAGTSRATPEDYQDFVASLGPEDRARLIAEGISGPPENGTFSNRFVVRDDDGLSKYTKNGCVRVCDPLTELHTNDDEDDESPDAIREDLADGLRCVFLWIISDNAEPAGFFKNPLRIARRFAIVCRSIGIGSFSELPLSKLAGLSGCTRANLSKISCDFRDVMGSKYLRGPGARESSRDIFRQSAIEAHERRRQAKPDDPQCP